MPCKSKVILGVKLVSLALLLAGLLFTSGCVVNPVSGQDELSFMSVPQEIALGRDNYPKTTQASNGVPADDPGLQSYVKKVGRRLAGASHRPELPWDFNVVNTSELNAFALPGGKISITRGLITAMKNEDELASVLGHEIGHVTARHSAQQYTRQVGVGLLVGAAGLALSGEDWGPAAGAAAGMAGGLVLLSYSRDMERQADQLGYVYMTQNGYNPKAQVDVFHTFQKYEKGSPGQVAALFASHPLTAERIQTAGRRADASPRSMTARPMKTSAFNRALALQRKRAPAYKAMDRGDSAMARKQYPKAEKEYLRAVGLFGGEGLFQTRLAQSRLAQGKKGPARKAAAKGAAKRPDLFVSQLMYGITRQAGGDYQGALKSYAKADNIMPGQINTYFLAAMCFDSLGQKQNAVRYYRAVADTAPNTNAGSRARQRLRALGAAY